MRRYTRGEFLLRLEDGEDHLSVLLDIASQIARTKQHTLILGALLQNQPLNPYDASRAKFIFDDLKKRAKYISDDLFQSSLLDYKPIISDDTPSVYAKRLPDEEKPISKPNRPKVNSNNSTHLEEDDGSANEELDDYSQELEKLERELSSWLKDHGQSKPKSKTPEYNENVSSSGSLIKFDEIEPKELLSYLYQAAHSLLSMEGFDKNGKAFVGGLSKDIELRPTQRDALKAYCTFLDKKDLSPEEKLRGFFEIPTGVGKTAIFVTLIREANRIANQNEKSLRSAIVVPTVPLLRQTFKSITEYAPELVSGIGFYGAGKKELSQPLTIMTYDAWLALTESGQLSSKNTNIVISDEVHRGTSERKEKSHFESFSGHTASIGFTATSRFDLNKSAENTHKNLIFSRSIPEAVRNGELCEYIQTQFYVIRVSPMRFNGEFKDAADLSADIRQNLRRQAWNKRAEAIYAYGRDMHTNDFLSDNQAGFFTADTYHADDLEKILNKNPILRQRAKEQGKKGVSVSIHSRMSPKEQVRRLEAYMNGEYMAVIGDEKFKEGFDHPPMKTIIDWPHTSIVDKAQILGRGARKWWNPEKERFEGMTFIDTIVYVGSRDPEKDAYDRANAISQATTARTIVEDAVVFAEGAEDRIKSVRSAKTKDEQQEDVQAPDTEVENIEFIKDIPATSEENNVPDYVLDVVSGEEHPLLPNPQQPGDENNPVIDAYDGNGIINPFTPTINPIDGKIETPAAIEIEGQDVEEYADLEDVYTLFNEADRIVRERKFQQENWIEVTSELKAHLKKEADRVGGVTLICKALEGKYASTPERIVYNVIYGRQQTAIKEHMDAIIQTCAALPDANIRTLTDLERKKINDEFARTGAGSSRLLSHMREVPEGLNLRQVDNIRENPNTKVRVDHIEAVLKTYSELRFITEDEREIIESYRNIHGVNAGTVHAETQKYGLDVSLSEVRRIMDGATTILRDTAIQAIIDVSPYKRSITIEEKQRISEERARNNVSAKRLLKLIEARPDDVDANFLNRVFNNQQKARGIQLKVIFDAFSKIAKDDARSSVDQERNSGVNNGVPSNDKI